MFKNEYIIMIEFIYTNAYKNMNNIVINIIPHSTGYCKSHANRTGSWLKLPLIRRSMQIPAADIKYPITLNL